MSDTTTETKPEINPYKQAAQNQKAGLLAAFFVALYERRGNLRFAARALATLDEDAWNDAAFKVGINPPSDETKDIVIEFVRIIHESTKTIA